MPDELRRLAQALSDEEFERVYGPVAAREPADAARLLEAMRALQDEGNSVLLVEHDPGLIAGADLVVDVEIR